MSDSRTLPWTDERERAYHRGMAKLAGDRGYASLARSHTLAAADCASGCQCQGCGWTRIVHAEMAKMSALKRRFSAEVTNGSSAN